MTTFKLIKGMWYVVKLPAGKETTTKTIKFKEELNRLGTQLLIFDGEWKRTHQKLFALTRKDIINIKERDGK